jgi:hypothetical protein
LEVYRFVRKNGEVSLWKKIMLSSVVGTGSTKSNTAITATSVTSLLIFILALWQIEGLPILVQRVYVHPCCKDIKKRVAFFSSSFFKCWVYDTAK